MAQIESYGWVRRTVDLVKSEIVRDEVVDSWFLMGSFWPIAGILCIYLLFVLKIGPKMMEDRKPLDVKTAMLVYNLFQVFQNGRMVWILLTWPGVMGYAASHMCSPLGKDENNPFYLPLCVHVWYYMISKITDLLDTVFFVLRKKQSHVSFLHVYHHVNMVLATWAFLKYMRGEHLVFVGALNAFVHVVMYSYYFLAALGPSVQRYLWWKKYITKLQILQFVMVIAFLSALVWYECKIVVSHYLCLTANAFGFLILFLRFYVQTYIQNKAAATVVANGKRRAANDDKSK